ncbi:DUF4190 domain-containing protein [Micromonospora sp. NPDC000089]|uniref:DUF4190 domain-containing protein n=1 Tax=unclassified Micromonospora TaxID=2617518 RepID=UPI0036C5619A
MTTDGAGSRPAEDERAPRRPAAGLLEVADEGWEPWSRPEPVRGRLSRTALAAFVLGLLGGLLAPPVAVVALRRIRRTGDRGRRLAVAGLVLFGVWVLVAVLALVVPALRSEPDAGVDALRVGECFRGGDPSGAQTAPARISRVACTEPHDGELVDHLPAYDRYADEAYPGAAELSRRAADRCQPRQSSYVLDPLALPAEARLRWYLPSRLRWADSPTITCYFTGGATPLTRPLRADATVLRPEQLAYLDATREYVAQRDALVAQAPTASLEALREAVRRTEAAHTRMWLRLSGRTWPEPARPAMAALVSEMEKSEPAWRDADRATAPAQVLPVVTQAQRHPTPATEQAVRRALGLPVVPGDPVR